MKLIGIMETYLYESLKDRKVKCNICSHHCIIKEGSRGRCCVRWNREGVLETLIYGRLIAEHIDPIEKKPLFHFMPGSLSFSIAAVGCNFKCLFCQNADIAQMPSDRNGMITGASRKPDKVVETAIKGDCKTIAYTYTEPIVNFEFTFDTAKAASSAGIKNVLVTNGYISSEALNMISPYIDAANVDLKGFTGDFYKKYCGARLEKVKDRLIEMKDLGIFLEVTTLLIPGLNDDPDKLHRLAQFIAESIGTETPWHVSRFHPTYKLCNRPPTPVSTLISARETGIRAGLKYVYIGNVPGEKYENTYCYNCKKLLIERWGFMVRRNLVENSLCPDCGVKIDGVF